MLRERPDPERVAAARSLLQSHKRNELLASQRQLLLDFDSTVYPLINAMGSHPLSRGASYENVTHWDGLIDLCGSREKMMAAFDEVFAYDWMRDHPPFDGVKEAMERMRDDGVTVRVVSARSARFEDDVRQYLDQYQIHHDSVLCRVPIDKIAWCLENEVTTAVEDDPGFISRSRAAGITTLGLRFIYNEDALADHSHHHADEWEILSDQLSCALARNVQRAITDALR